MGSLKRAFIAVVTFPLYILGGLAFLAVFGGLFVILNLFLKDLPDVMRLSENSFWRGAIVYLIPGVISLLVAEKAFEKAMDAFERLRARGKNGA